tara:strand:- start:246 stop:791 length:546 start_codon:yes stop_codon:yes gene_type:complete
MLSFYYGAMNAGKSATLLQMNYNYRERGKRTLLLIPEVVGKAIISSRIGLEADAIVVSDTSDIYALVADDTTCIFVDEAQFLSTDQVLQLNNVSLKLEINVICFGLRTDFQGKLFEGASALFAIADDFKELTTLCWCGNHATMTLRVHDGIVVCDGPQLQVGNNASYVSVCRQHWFERRIA